jgi:hypothetical protein
VEGNKLLGQESLSCLPSRGTPFVDLLKTGIAKSLYTSGTLSIF